MNDGIPRRDFLALLGISAGALTLPAAASVGDTLFAFDPEIPEARRLARNSIAAHALAGDRIRFARMLIGKRPRTLAGLTRYPDFLLLGGCAEEAGYRVASLERSGQAFAWIMRRGLGGG